MCVKYFHDFIITQTTRETKTKCEENGEISKINMIIKFKNGSLVTLFLTFNSFSLYAIACLLASILYNKYKQNIKKKKSWMPMLTYLWKFKKENLLLLAIIIFWVITNVMSSLSLTWMLDSLIKSKWDSFIFWSVIDILCWGGYSIFQIWKDSLKEKLCQEEVNLWKGNTFLYKIYKVFFKR